ncbi:LacI family DNA-binding transcriptional regulator [Sorangium sp. So ce1078]|uniref:LacI family DNA-binding transcriptional regulator n=1 Tax=Sorangium sp. So ce1078 TaxID=3133329 RepID=UPI003F5F94F5
MKRPTITDIAWRAGVSKGAVSYALNGRPGVSEPTRERILAIAAELGWQPSNAARALSDGRAGAVGLVIDRPAHTLGIEPFFMQLISGIEAELSEKAEALLLKVTEDRAAELETYRRWWAERRVDGVILVDLCEGDPRVKLVEELKLPAVVVGGPAGKGRLSGVWSDDASAMRAVVDYLAALGHRSIARVAGPAEFMHTALRTKAFNAAARQRRLERVQTVHADYTGEAGGQATRRLLAGTTPPTAIVFDNDVMAVAALAVAQEMRVAVPERLSIVAWDDSALCQLVHPALTAVRRNIAEHGSHAAALLLRLVAGEPIADVECSAPTLATRGSTAPPPRA